MRNVNVTTQLRIALTADDWQLYDKPGRQSAALELNKRVEAAINAAPGANAAYDLGECELAKFAAYGAHDTEGRAVLARLVALRFPRA